MSYIACVYDLQVKIQGKAEEMLRAACQQFLGKNIKEIQKIALETLEGHQRAIMGNMTVEVVITFLLLSFSRIDFEAILQP